MERIYEAWVDAVVWCLRAGPAATSWLFPLLALGMLLLLLQIAWYCLGVLAVAWVKHGESRFKAVVAYVETRVVGLRDSFRRR